MSDTETTAVTARLSTLDRFLPLWIGLAMVAGLLLGRFVPDLNDHLDAVKVDTVSLPIAVGLLAMMYPVLAKVRYRHIGVEATRDRAVGVTLAFNWVVGPLLMFALAWVFLPDLPELRTGLIIVGIAPCIAMVLIWNDLAFGNRELAAVLVAVNSLLQIVAFSAYGWFLLTVLPGWVGLDGTLPRRVAVVDRPVGADLPRGAAARRVPHPHDPRGPPRHRVVRGHVPPPHRTGGAVRPAVHDRGAVRPAGGEDHLEPLRRGPGGAARCSSTSPSCGRARSSPGTVSATPTTARPRWPSPRRATTSSWPSRCRSACSG